MGQAWRFGTGLRRFLREPIDATAAAEHARSWLTARDERFLQSLDRLVWPFPQSPSRQLLECAGVERGDVHDLVRTNGLTPALEHLRDAGVYVTYEEFRGDADAVRGSRRLHFTPADFANPTVTPDFMATTGGTRSGGTVAGSSFEYRTETAVTQALHLSILGLLGIPNAVWIPALPSAAGLSSNLTLAKLGQPAERWFSQTDPAMPELPPRKRLANLAIPWSARLVGAGIPTPELTPTDRPEPVLAWVRDALARSKNAMLTSYPTSAVALATHAVAQGGDLAGLTLRIGGEPVTSERRDAIEAAGARVVDLYAFTPTGTVGFGCDGSNALHVMEQLVAVVSRRRERTDGVSVDAYCWTSLSPAAPHVMINVENDDYGEIIDNAACGCQLADLGLHRKVVGVRGMSKVVAGGTTVSGEVFEELVEVVLPRAIGGGPGDFQFAERAAGAETALLIRVSPRIGEVDPARVIAVVQESLRKNDVHAMAARMWESDGALQVVREAPRQARSGKTLPFEPLPPSSGPSAAR